MPALNLAAFEDQQSPFLAFAWKGGFFAHSTINNGIRIQEHFL
ncbi:hypothetical protein AAJP84_02490 [Bartonella schoenbuchensis]